MEELKIEMDGKDQVLRLQRPTHKHTRDMRKSVMPLYKDIRAMQAQLEKEDENLDVNKYLELSEQTNGAMQDIILELHDKTLLKTRADFDRVAEEDIQKLYDWLRSKSGVTRSAEQERFL